MTPDILREASGIGIVCYEPDDEPHNYTCSACGTHCTGHTAPILCAGKPVCGDCARRPTLTKETAFHGL